MRLKVNYIDSDIVLNQENILSIEIENKNIFYKLVNDLLLISLGELVDNISFYNESNIEINMNNKISIIIDYFNFNFDVKKYTSEINKLVLKNIDEKLRQDIITNYNKISNNLRKILNEIDLPLQIVNDFNLEDLLKFIKISVNKFEDLLENLFLIIDLEKILRIKDIIIFVNLKQFLSKNELEELYKYAIYNNVNILLIDSQTYGACISNEKKLIIDCDLDEFIL